MHDVPALMWLYYAVFFFFPFLYLYLSLSLLFFLCVVAAAAAAAAAAAVAAAAVVVLNCWVAYDAKPALLDARFSEAGNLCGPLIMDDVAPPCWYDTNWCIFIALCLFMYL